MIYGKLHSGFFMPKICNSLAAPLNSYSPCYTRKFYAAKIINGVCSNETNPDFGSPRIDEWKGSPGILPNIPSKAYVATVRDYYTIKTYNFCIRIENNGGNMLILDDLDFTISCDPNSPAPYKFETVY